MKFRPTRETFDEAMKELREITNLSDLFILCSQHVDENDPRMTVFFEYQGYDSRWKADSYLISINGVLVGYGDGRI